MSELNEDSKPLTAGQLTLRVLVLQWVGLLLWLLLAAAWLRIPDSHTWQFALSMLSGAALVVGLLWIEISTFRRLRLPVGLAPFWRRLILLFLLVVLWGVIFHWIEIARDQAPLWAGYWNSKLSHGVRYVVTYERLVTWQRFAWSLVLCCVTALLLPVAIEASTGGLGGHPWPRIRGVYRHWRYWLAAFGCAFAGYIVASGLSAWKPGTDITAQVVSVLVRLGIVYTVIVLLWTFIVSLAVDYLGRDEADSYPEPSA
jgi:hypothetical protein